MNNAEFGLGLANLQFDAKVAGELANRVIVAAINRAQLPVLRVHPKSSP
jgi:hypothetical protein